METTRTVDAHQHFWNYDPAEYGWIDDSMAVLRRNFLPVDLHAEMAAAGVSGSVAVQARQTIEETNWLLKLAAENDVIEGVVGWAPIADRGFPRLLDDLAVQPKLKGLRHVVQGEPDRFLGGADFNAGIATLLPTALVYDVLILERQLQQATAFVDRHPKQIFVLDHIAKPRITEGAIEPWAANLTELARHENVYCKLSGMVTEADWSTWTAASLEPYIDVVLQAFGPERLMAGSDWPVCTVACNYTKWFTTLRESLASLSINERERIFGGTAIEVYRLRGN